MSDAEYIRRYIEISQGQLTEDVGPDNFSEEVFESEHLEEDVEESKELYAIIFESVEHAGVVINALDNEGYVCEYTDNVIFIDSTVMPNINWACVDGVANVKSEKEYYDTLEGDVYNGLISELEALVDKYSYHRETSGSDEYNNGFESGLAFTVMDIEDLINRFKKRS